jgi:hypothetical protein
MVEDVLVEEREQLLKHLSETIRAGFRELKNIVGDARVIAGDRLRIADVSLAHLDEVTTLLEQTKRGVNEVTGQAVENDVEIGGLEARLEIERPRGGEMSVVKSEMV